MKFRRKGLLQTLPVLAAFVLLCPAAFPAQPDETAPIMQPGAPGAPSREITAEQSLELGRSHYTPADARFMQHMIVHHSQAVEMGGLIEARTSNRRVRLLGQRIALSQTGEIAMMQTWLTRRGEAVEMPGHGAGHMAGEGSMPSTTPLMPGMLSPAQMVELTAAEGRQFDELFLTGMIEHHQGAIGMVEALLNEPGGGEDPEMSDFLTAIIADQSTEIQRMRAMLAEIG
ncbi:DUF305 domain-containing protein [uncultured Maricaulis sp.]|uniref:DUF305 domain-containing protein n=1 Tax=uncultured Maricaulis sp. TaxID=174710 RepID=UPI0030DD6018|tara:strand:- start:2041 stop:2727 length:687 start_codon:yes stop_codon:yes gene_type:complete